MARKSIRRRRSSAPLNAPEMVRVRFLRRFDYQVPGQRQSVAYRLDATPHNERVVPAEHAAAAIDAGAAERVDETAAAAESEQED